ncbi:hypothetical protein AWH62_15760 [Maricaulis sp. W15]|uniref:LysR family transcriptional regulator n=1 Tax=Maricaulis sp. W15 TaxID=1772333 RepID=UPI000948E8BB|nr:LysR family transcriptional regulator [Maricaulis sp. W15]OLF78290.1 hypothetical protein AWH62_15760 [Maricaulis sp. W15]
MDRFLLLNTFRRVVELDGFAAAARDLGLSNASVSKHVAQLESHLGVALLVRTTRRLSLTDAGRDYYRNAVHILDTLTEADDQAGLAGVAPRGRIRMTAPMSLGLADLTDRLVDFREQYPEITLDVLLDDRQVDLVEHGLDLAIRGAGPLADSSLRGRRLTPMDRWLVASPRYLESRGTPTSPDQLTDHACLAYSHAAVPDVWRFSRDGAEVEVGFNGPMRISNSIAIVTALVRGQGIALVPAFLAERELAAGQLVRVLDRWESEPRSLHVLYPGHREHSARVRALIDFLVATYRERPLGRD